MVDLPGVTALEMAKNAMIKETSWCGWGQSPIYLRPILAIGVTRLAGHALWAGVQKNGRDTYTNDFLFSCLSYWRYAGTICRDSAQGKTLHTASSEFEMLSPRDPSGNTKGRLDARTPLVWR